MPKLDLTDRFCATIKTQRIVDFFDSKTTGLGLRVSPSGGKVWSVMFTEPRDGKRARVTLGKYPAVTLARARTMALEAHTRVAEGVDPRQDETGAAMTIGTLAELFIDKHVRTLKTHKAFATRIRNNIVKHRGKVKLAELHRRDVHRVVDIIADRGSPLAASKAQQDMKAMVRWAIQRGYLDSDPMVGMQGALKSKPRERFLTEDEISKLWPSLSVMAKPVEIALKLALVTGQRIGEVCAMREDELDVATWTIPADKTKNGSRHVVPLTPMALDLIAAARRGAINGRLFPTFDSVKLGHALQDARPRLPVKDWTAHDLRRSVATHLAMMAVSPITIGAVLNHSMVTKGGVTMGHYVRYDYAREKSEALELWAERLAAIIRGDTVADVIPMRSRAGA
jgi:integrase